MNNEDKDWIRRMREIRHLVTPDVKWPEEDHDPREDIRALLAGMDVAGERRMEFYCGLHGQQGARRVIFCSFELECGCQITMENHAWTFSTLEDRNRKPTD